MTALNELPVSGDKPERPYKTRYDSVVVVNGLYDPGAIDRGSLMGLHDICETADAALALSASEFYCVAATHFYTHGRKKSVSTLALELECSERTISSLIESGKKNIIDKLNAAKSLLATHPVLRVRVYPVRDGEDSVLSIAPVVRNNRKVTPSMRLDRMSSTLFDADTHFAVSSYYLHEPEARLTAKQVAQALGLSESGVRQKLNEARNVLRQASEFQPLSKELLTHAMFTREDPYHSNRRLAPLLDEKLMALESKSAAVIFEKASRLDLRFLIPLMRTHFYGAVHKQSLQDIARELKLSQGAVEEYVVQGKDRLLAILREEAPLLAAHPILRPHRYYQSPDELARPFESLFPDNLNELPAQSLVRLTWANVLLNRQPYYLNAWSLDIPERGLKKAFAGTDRVSEVTTYSTLVQSLKVIGKLCAQAESVEQEVFGAGIKVNIKRPASESPGLSRLKIRDFQ